MQLDVKTCAITNRKNNGFVTDVGYSQLVLSILDRVDTADATRTVSYKELYLVDITPQVSFPLSHLPNSGTVKVNINGITYYDGFKIDEENYTLSWLFSEEAGGFDITESEVVIEYTYDSMKEQEANEDG